MDKVNIELKISPFSTNKTRAVFQGRNISTVGYKNWKKEINTLLLGHRAQLKLFASNFNSSQHYIYTRYTFGKPVDSLFTKKGSVSKRGGDTQCYVKTLQDAIFTRLNNYNSDIDDAQVINYVVRTIPSEEWQIGVYLEISELDGLKGI